MAGLTGTITVVMLSLVLAENCTIEEYYWREFSGKIPSDAYQLSGYFIGKLQVSKSVVPVVLSRDLKTRRYFYGGKYEYGHKNVKILCSQHKNRFKLIKANPKLVVSLYEQGKLVLVGFQDKASLCLGQQFFSGNNRVGYIPIHTNTSQNVFHAVSFYRPLYTTYYSVVTYNVT